MNFDLEKINIAVEICKDIQKAGATNVMVAGGFVRDMLLNKPINDIDVFYEGNIVSPYEKKEPIYPKASAIFTALNEDTFAQMVQSLQEFEAFDSYPDSDWKVTSNKVYKPGVEWPIQLIQCKDWESHLGTFGADISKMAITTEGLFLSLPAISNIVNEVISFNELESKYAKKIQAKYPEYLYV